ncbi:hypothetical protein CVU37_11775 [candidate division BRC1 bacterium HGW-BRC1-1]|nr:MAG: hypothetical protein CVU37_11775 [candidate division BRC1 bacterium HGW-BRC1-1]
MSNSSDPQEVERYQQELNLLEQVHVALGTASKLDDFYLITASLLVDPNAFGYSRAFILRCDERCNTFIGRVALGLKTAEEDKEFRNSLMEETLHLQELVKAIETDSGEAHAIQPLYDLRYHTLWIEMLQADSKCEDFNLAFRDVSLHRDGLPSNHLLEIAATSTRASLIEGDGALDGLEDFISTPCVAGRLITRRGLHGIVIADCSFESDGMDEERLYHFQWLLNHASVTLENVELVEDLTATTIRLQEMDRLKTNFLSIVSHELRTPLTSIIGFVHLLLNEKMGALTRPQLDLLKRVSQHSSHLQSMVNDILEIAEVEGGGMVNVMLEHVDPLEAFLSVLPRVENRRGSRNIVIEPVLQDTVPLVWADQNALERVYYHLLENAVKFIPTEGRVTLEFNEHEGMLDIAIQDTGIGISEENLKKIFDHFYQVDFRLERVYGGMGIGLTVVKLLLDAMKGRIRVESTEGQGSRFILSFPVVPTGRRG